jgi:hypothetical protein
MVDAFFLLATALLPFLPGRWRRVGRCPDRWLCAASAVRRAEAPEGGRLSPGRVDAVRGFVGWVSDRLSAFSRVSTSARMVSLPRGAPCSRWQRAAARRRPSRPLPRVAHTIFESVMLCRRCRRRGSHLVAARDQPDATWPVSLSQFPCAILSRSSSLRNDFSRYAREAPPPTVGM